jgi:hypothetical protein
MTVLVKDVSYEDAVKGIAMRFGSTEEWARALVATFVEFGLLKFEKAQSFREIKQEISSKRVAPAEGVDHARESISPPSN